MEPENIFKRPEVNIIDRGQFEKENDELLDFVFENRFFKPWRDNRDSLGDNTKLSSVSNLELYITSDCNLKCEYCYLNKYGDKLYPKEFRNHSTILTNLRSLMDWMLENNYSPSNIDLFSGEIWHTDFGIDVLNLLLDYSKRGFYTPSLTIPTNCSFILFEDYTYKIQTLIEEFDRLGTRLIISCSIDGKPIESNTRSFKDDSLNSKRDDSFYERLFVFAKKNGFLFHPMVAASNVKDWIPNLKWFTSMLEEYEIHGTEDLMMLEVRNGDWGDESIQDLLDYYDFEIEEELKKLNGDINAFAYKVIGMGDAKSGGYVNYGLPLSENQPGCSIPYTFSVRLGDLSIVPCHRASYENFIYGKFELRDGKIEGIRAHNPQMAVRILCSNNILTHHGCDVCPYKGICMKGCFGSQYESVKELFMPIPNVCKMFKSKYNHLIDKYESLGVINVWRDVSEYSFYYEYLQELLKIIDTIQSSRRGK